MAFSLRNLLSTASIFILATPCFAAEVFYAPTLCEPSELTLEIKNTSKDLQRFWTQTRGTAGFEEQAWDVEPQGSLNIEATDFLYEPKAFSLKTWQDGVLRFSVRCAKESSVPLGTLASPLVTHYFPREVRSLKLHLTNLFIQKHTILVSAFAASGKLIESQSLELKNYYDTSSTKLSFQEDVARLEIHGDARLHSWVFYDSGFEDRLSPGLSLKPMGLQPDMAKTYFLVSTREAPRKESFVIGLTRPEQIQTARAQINPTGFEKIIVARITSGHGQENRNFFSKDKVPYSWSVTEVDAFADFAHISCDGSPDTLEERLPANLNDGGRICFWRYRIVRELTAQEVAQGRLDPR